MTKKYVCSPKTGRVIEVGGSTYKKVSKNAKFKNKLERSPKSSSKKKLTPCKSPRRRRKSAKGKKRRGRPRGPVKCGSPKGWGAIKPGGHERTVMLEKCGKKCFLGRDKTFPICAAGTCRRSPKGVSAACIRARQMSSPRARKVNGRSKAYYNRIAERALAMRNSRRYSANGALPPTPPLERQEGIYINSPRTFPILGSMNNPTWHPEIQCADNYIVCRDREREDEAKHETIQDMLLSDASGFSSGRDVADIIESYQDNCRHKHERCLENMNQMRRFNKDLYGGAVNAHLDPRTNDEREAALDEFYHKVDNPPP